MRKKWNIPSEKMFRFTGEDWLQLLLGQLDDVTAARVLLILWRS
jgi:hypothetical protein